MPLLPHPYLSVLDDEPLSDGFHYARSITILEAREWLQDPARNGRCVFAAAYNRKRQNTAKSDGDGTYIVMTDDGYDRGRETTSDVVEAIALLMGIQTSKARELLEAQMEVVTVDDSRRT